MAENQKPTAVTQEVHNIKIQPYEMANFNLIEFASIYNKFIDMNQAIEINTQWMDKDGLIHDVKIENVAMTRNLLKADVNKEKQERIKADQILNTEITEVKTFLTNSLNEEIKTRIQDNQQLSAKIDNVNKTLTDKITKTDSDLEAEVSRAKSVEHGLNESIAKEVNDRIASDKALDDKFSKEISDETNAREAADDKLNTKIDTVNTNLNSKIDQEIKDRINGDTKTLSDSKTYTNNAVSVESAARVAADDKLNASLTKEINDRIASDGNLKFNKDIKNNDGSTPDNLTDAINDVDNKISFEINDVNNKVIKIDQNLKEEIDSVSKKVEAILAGSSTDLDSFKELVDYVNKIDAEDDQALAKFMKDTLSNLNILYTGVGFDKDGYKAPEEVHYISEVKSLFDADKKLDSALYVTANNVEAEVSRAEEAEGNLKFNDDIKNNDGSTPDNLTDAINDVDDKVKALYDAFGLSYDSEDSKVKGLNLQPTNAGIKPINNQSTQSTQNNQSTQSTQKTDLSNNDLNSIKNKLKQIFN